MITDLRDERDERLFDTPRPNLKVIQIRKPIGRLLLLLMFSIRLFRTTALLLHRSLSLSFQIQVNFSSLIMAHHDEIQLSFSSSSSLYKQKRNKSNDQMFLIFTGDWVIHYRQHVESRNRGRRFIDRTVVAALRRRPVARATRHRMRGLSSQTHVVCRSVRDRISYFSFGSTPSSSWLNRIFYLRWWRDPEKLSGFLIYDQYVKKKKSTNRLKPFLCVRSNNENP